MHKLAERSSGALLVAFRPEISNERVTRDPTLSGSSEYQQKCQCLALTRDGVHAPSAALEKASAKCVKPDHSALFFRIHGNLTLDLRDDSRYRAFNTRIHSADWTEPRDHRRHRNLPPENSHALRHSFHSRFPFHRVLHWRRSDGARGHFGSVPIESECAPVNCGCAAFRTMRCRYGPANFRFAWGNTADRLGDVR